MLTQDYLFDTITYLYTELNEMFNINLDERDSQNIPLVKTKNFRTIKVHYSKTTYKSCYCSGRTECSININFKLLVAVIEMAQCILNY